MKQMERQVSGDFTYDILPMFLKTLILLHTLASVRPGTRGREVKDEFLKRTLTSRSVRRARLSTLCWKKTSVHRTACSNPTSTNRNSQWLNYKRDLYSSVQISHIYYSTSMPMAKRVQFPSKNSIKGTINSSILFLLLNFTFFALLYIYYLSQYIESL